MNEATESTPVNPIPEQLAEGIVVALKIDTSGLTCPLPILRAKKALAGLSSGDVLEVLATDKNSLKDFQAFCRQTHNALLAQTVTDEQFVHWLQKR